MNPLPRNLLIAYGNPLRSDDGVARRIAEEVTSWKIPGVIVLSIHQLLPELVDDLARAKRVLFVDAIASEGEVKLHRIEATRTLTFINHTADPRGLLALTQDLHGQIPEGWLLTIPGTCFDLGENLSPQAKKNQKAALTLIRDWLAW